MMTVDCPPPQSPDMIVSAELGGDCVRYSGQADDGDDINCSSPGSHLSPWAGVAPLSLQAGGGTGGIKARPGWFTW